MTYVDTAAYRSAGSERREASVTKAAVSTGSLQKGRQRHSSGRSLAARLAHFSFFHFPYVCGTVLAPFYAD